MQNLGTLGGYTSSAWGINVSGQVVGSSPTADGNNHAFLYSGNGPMQNLDTLPGGTFSQALGINASGQVMGSSANHAFIWQAGSGMQNLGTLGGNTSSAWGINNSGQVVGNSETSGGPAHAFLYSGNGPMQDLGTLLGGTSSHATGINDSGKIVGYASTSDNPHAFLYSGGSMTDLNSLVDLDSGWTLEQANAINNIGQIVGMGRNAAGQGFAFLLTPIPEPSTLALLGAGAVGLLLFVWRRRRRAA
jgi:probable HAF family extracellular repeat protein